MKKRFLALLLLIPAAALAQENEVPIQVPDNLFFSTDLEVIVPRNRLSIGSRFLTGAKSSFRGQGTLESVQFAGDFSDRGIARGYHDGAVNLDARRRTVDDGSGNLVSVPVVPDGMSNAWRYLESGQVTPSGDIAMSTYRTESFDAGAKSREINSSYGVELTIRQDLRRTARVSWTLLGGLSLNGIGSRASSTEDALVTKLTDTYSLDGAPPPAAPYPGISPIVPLIDANGNPVIGPDGSQVTNSVDQTVLIVTDPQARTTTTEVRDDVVNNHFDLHGAYFSFRAGPSVELPIGRWFQASMSAGAALVYAGTTYTVRQDFDPETGSLITDTLSSSKNSLLPGYYADANVEVFLTERAGFFLGAVYQNTGGFTQSIHATTGDFSTKVDLKNMAGYRMGLNVRF